MRDGVIVSAVFLIMGAVLIYAAAHWLPPVASLPLAANVVGIICLLLAPLVLISTFLATVWPGSKKKLEQCDR
jgi:uncharacterized membrane protein